MEVIQSLADMTAWSQRIKASGQTIALVPTMGYFHAGHLSLMRLAAEKADKVVVSLFVNAMQFGPQEDLSRYPRDFDRDMQLAANEGVDVLFAPSHNDMYPEDFNTRVLVKDITATLCGKQRPVHFEGVTTVVAKLFHIVKAHCAIFGEKDFQQLSVIRKMTRDLNWDIDIIGHPIVREEDGLAMSSRNVYLAPEERDKALNLYRALEHAKLKIRAGMTDAAHLIAEVKDIILASHGVKIDYVSIVDCESLADKTTIDKRSVLALAVKVGGTRLIDNCFLGNEI
jgi:pantoate--beta-alanine ligase